MGIVLVRDKRYLCYLFCLLGVPYRQTYSHVAATGVQLPQAHLRHLLLLRATSPWAGMLVLVF